MNENRPVFNGQPEYITICGVISLILVIIGFIIPVIGAGYIVPTALIFSTISLSGKTTGIGISTTVIGAVKLSISPTFWFYLVGTFGIKNLLMAWIGVACIGLSIYFMVKRRR